VSSLRGLGIICCWIFWKVKAEMKIVMQKFDCRKNLCKEKEGVGLGKAVI
jgi:hypothetical protein